MHRIVLSLGTNLGEREENIKRAIFLISQNNIRVLQVSQTVATPPWGEWNQPPFLNVVIIAETQLEPETLLKTLKGIEKLMGRRSGHMKPRIIDIDIIFFDDAIVNTKLLKIPHPHFRERSFVLTPLVEIAPHLIDPVTGKNILQLYNELLKMPFVGYVNTPMGPFYVAEKDGKIIKTSFNQIVGRREPTPILVRLLQHLNKYFTGSRIDFLEYKLDFTNTSETYRRIYSVLRNIPYGTLIPYSKLADLSGIHNGAKLVGRAMHKNPFPIIVPCHRVIRKNGSIGGFSSGKERKIFLLKLELKSNFSKIFSKGTL